MTPRRPRIPNWTAIEGTATISTSTIAAIAIRNIPTLSDIPGIKTIHDLSQTDSGLIAAAATIAFPTTAILFGATIMISTAITIVQNWSDRRIRNALVRAEAKGKTKGLAQGKAEGREEGREQGRNEGFDLGSRSIYQAIVDWQERRNEAQAAGLEFTDPMPTPDTIPQNQDATPPSENAQQPSK